MYCQKVQNQLLSLKNDLGYQVLQNKTNPKVHHANLLLVVDQRAQRNVLLSSLKKSIAKPLDLGNYYTI